jgi:hypothetical protein
MISDKFEEIKESLTRKDPFRVILVKNLLIK